MVRRAGSGYCPQNSRSIIRVFCTLSAALLFAGCAGAKCKPGYYVLRGEWADECLPAGAWPRVRDSSECPAGLKYNKLSSLCLPPAPKCGKGFMPLPGQLTAAGWKCVRIKPTKCPPGTGPFLARTGWTCKFGNYWPNGPYLTAASCAPGTRFNDPSGACLPPAFKCPPGWLPWPDPTLVWGWHCVKHNHCAAGKTNYLTAQGWQCE
jgi:hypothetical protein